MTRHNPPVNWRTNQVFLGEHTITACAGSRRGDIDIQTVTAAQIKRTLSREQAQDVETYVNVVKPAEIQPTPGATDLTKHLNEEQRGQLQSLLDHFTADVFSEPQGLPPRRAADHRIELLPGSNPSSRSPYRLSQPELEELRKQLAKLIEQGWMVHSLQTVIPGHPKAPVWSADFGCASISPSSTKYNNSVGLSCHGRCARVCVCVYARVYFFLVVFNSCCYVR